MKAEWWRPGLAEEALALIDPASVAADNWALIAEEKNYGTRAFYRFDFLNTPLSDADGLTQEHREEIRAFEKALASARLVLEQSPVIYYPYRYDIRWVEYPNAVSVTGAFPRGETRQVLTRQSGSSWTADQGIDIPGGPPIRPTTPFAAPRWADTAGVLGRSCAPVEEIWTRGSPVTDSCTLNAIETALDYLWTGSSELRQRAVRDGHVLTDLFGRLDNQDNGLPGRALWREGKSRGHHQSAERALGGQLGRRLHDLLRVSERASGPRVDRGGKTGRHQLLHGACPNRGSPSIPDSYRGNSPWVSPGTGRAR